jgi:hypothetical protein
MLPWSRKKMGRREMPLTEGDLEDLVTALRCECDSVTGMAQAIGVARPHIYRLIRRANTALGHHSLEWKVGSRFYFPPEIRRLANAWASFCEARLEESRFPRVACGRSLRLLLQEFILRLSLEATARLSFVRSGRSGDLLKEGVVDLLMAHKSRLEEMPSMHTETVELQQWRAVIVRPKLRVDTSMAAIQWQPGSHAQELSQSAAQLDRAYAKLRAGVRAESYLEALELVRRRLPLACVVPDIYLRNTDWTELDVSRFDAIGDTLVAVFRAIDRDRLAALVDPSAWKSLTDRRRE